MGIRIKKGNIIRAYDYKIVILVEFEIQISGVLVFPDVFVVVISVPDMELACRIKSSNTIGFAVAGVPYNC